jgi:hypothetical protein
LAATAGQRIIFVGISRVFKTNESISAASSDLHHGPFGQLNGSASN